jgi:autotransporter-associated beta strand protein
VAGTVTVANTFAGAGNLRLQLSGVAAANTYVNNVTSYTGNIRLTNVGGTGNKWNLNNRGTLGAGLTIDSGSQLFASGGTNVFSKGILVSGTGNNESRGVIRLIGTLGGPITLLGSTTIGTEGGSLSGVIQGGVEGQHILTFGTTNSKGNATVLQTIRDGTGVVSLLKVAAGTLTLMGTNSYSGATTISAGTLKINTPAALSATSAIILSGGILDLAGASPVASPAIVPSLAGNGGTLRLSTTDKLVISGNMTGSLVVSISDPQSLVEGTTYIVATYGGLPPASVLLQNVPLPWMASRAGGEIRVFKLKGTLLNIR